MKLLRYGGASCEQPGVLDSEGNVRSLAGHINDIDGPTIASGRLEEIDTSQLPIVSKPGRLGPCVANAGKFICIGLNYADHAAESDMPLPSEPEVFTKATSAICGPNDDIVQPLDSDKLDWEVELALVIGKQASYATSDEAEDCIFGYMVCNDVSERGFQLERGSQWDKGKGCDTFGPIGPWLVTKDEIADPLALSMWLEVNGIRYQDGSTKTMIFKPAFIVEYLSRFMSLQPGDIISTGTPPGVGLGQKPPTYLNPGDTISLGIEGLGEQHQTVVAYRRQRCG